MMRRIFGLSAPVGRVERFSDATALGTPASTAAALRDSDKLPAASVHDARKARRPNSAISGISFRASGN
jgi:hypothetical protein